MNYVKASPANKNLMAPQKKQKARDRGRIPVERLEFWDRVR